LNLRLHPLKFHAMNSPDSSKVLSPSPRIIRTKAPSTTSALIRRHLTEILAAGEEIYSELKNLVVWVKTNVGQGSFYRSQHELILVFKSGDGPHQNNIELGRHGRSRSNVWTYGGVNSFRAGRLDELSIHPTVKPVALVADAMRDCSRRGDIVLDPFMGSGTTILAAERVGRRGYGLEIDPLYVDAAIRRWQDFTKRDAILKPTGQTFDAVAAARSSAKRRRAKWQTHETKTAAQRAGGRKRGRRRIRKAPSRSSIQAWGKRQSERPARRRQERGDNSA
jgi:hypothetical protein